MSKKAIQAKEYLKSDRKEKVLRKKLQDMARDSLDYADTMKKLKELQEDNRGIWYDSEGKMNIDKAVCAEYILSRCALFCVGTNLYYAYNFNVHYYKKISNRTLRKMVRRVLAEYDRQLQKSGMVGSILSELSDIVDEVEELEETKGIAVFRNGTLYLHLDSEEEMTFEKRFSSENVVFTALPYDYNPQAVCPKFLSVVSEWMSGNESLVALLRDCLANIFSFGEVYMHQIVFFYGKGRNGKSVLLDLLDYIFPKMVSHSSLSQWTEKFGTFELVGKVLNVSAEDKAEIWNTEEIKRVSAGDTISVEQKFKDHVSARITAKLIVATNNIPKFTDMSKGWEERFIIIPFEQTYARKKKEGDKVPNPYLLKELKKEREGIAAWLLDGLEDLKQRGWKLSECEKAERLKEKTLLDAQPVLLFFKSCIQKCDQTGKEKIKTSDVHRNFLTWANHNNIDVSKFNDCRAFQKEFRNILNEHGSDSYPHEIRGHQYYRHICMKKGFVKKLYYKK